MEYSKFMFKYKKMLPSQWRSKRGQVGARARGAGLGGVPAYFLQSFKNAF